MDPVELPPLRWLPTARARGAHFGLPVGQGPAVVLLGGITASARALGPGGWWEELGQRLSLAERFTVLCPDLPDHGPPTGAAGLADHVAAWLEDLGAPPVALYGASLGAMIGQALAQRHPARVGHLVAISAGLRPDPWGTGIRHLQRRLVRAGQPSLARQLGMLTYRGRREIARRFAAMAPDEVEPPVAAYLDHHGEKFARGFSPERYLFLSEAIDRTDLTGGLEDVRARVDVIGVPDDLLFPLTLQQEQVDRLRAAGVAARLHLLDADTGHDAFLTHQAELAALISELS